MKIVAPAVFAAPGLVALLLVVVLLIRLKRKDRLRRHVAPWVAAIHERAWYCARCAGTFFRTGTVPDAVATETLIPIGAFRDTVWLFGYQQWQIQRDLAGSPKS